MRTLAWDCLCQRGYKVPRSYDMAQMTCTKRGSKRCNFSEKFASNIVGYLVRCMSADDQCSTGGPLRSSERQSRRTNPIGRPRQCSCNLSCANGTLSVGSSSEPAHPSLFHPICVPSTPTVDARNACCLSPILENWWTTWGSELSEDADFHSRQL